MKAYRFIGKSGIQVIQNEPYNAVVEELFVNPEDRGKGVARKLMKATCKDADKEFVTLVLKPHPFGMYDIDKEIHYPPSTTYKELCAFYREFGFRFKPKPYINLMQRTPKECLKR